MITVITTKRKKELETREVDWATTSTRLSEAHRWFSEYDLFLKPLWTYLIEGGYGISHARECVAQGLLAHINEGINAGIKQHLDKLEAEKLVAKVLKAPKKKKTKKAKK